jgi:hypothetical protein
MFGNHLGLVPEILENCEEMNRRIEYDPTNFYRYIRLLHKE